MNNSLHELKVEKKVKVPFIRRWNSECQTAFDALKTKLTHAPVLGFADYSKPFILETDASHVGLGAVLSQDQESELKVIVYASRRLRPSEKNPRNYSSMKLELLALKWAVTEKFRTYLLGSKFEVFTDNKPLKYLQTTSKLGGATMGSLLYLTSPSTIGVEDQMEMLMLYHVNPMDHCPTKQKTPKKMTYYTLRP